MPDALKLNASDSTPITPPSPEPSAKKTASPATRTPSLSPELLAQLGFYAVLTFSLLWVFFHTFFVDGFIVRICDRSDVGIPPEERPPYLLAPMAFDGYVWNIHAENLGKNGQFRMRWTDFDNAPRGREIHWNSAFGWYLRALGEIYRSFTNEPLHLSISRMSIWANPILLSFILVFAGLFAKWRFGPLCGSVVLIGMVTTPTFYEGFLPAYPDHHGLIALTIFGLSFGLAWAGGGWIQPPTASGFVAPKSFEQARFGIYISALFGAMGMWFSALSTTLVLGAVSTGVLATTFVFAASARENGLTFHAELLRLWAKLGAIFSLLFYALEYFPNHLSMRLEVNHPLYALAWFGGGYILAELCDWLAKPENSRPPLPILRIGLYALACLPLPAAILLGGPSVYIPNDEFMKGLWKNITELLPLMTRMQIGNLNWMTAFGLYPLLIVLGFFLLFSPRLQAGTKLVVFFLIVPILVTTGLQFYQSRWGMLGGPLYISLAAVVMPVLWRLAKTSFLGSRAAAFAILAFGGAVIYPAFNGWLRPAWLQYSQTENTPIDFVQGLHLLHRELSKIIKNNAQGKPVTLLTSPNSSCLMGYFGKFKTLGTLYWENVDGLKSAAKLLNAQSEDEALRLFKEYGITHVYLMTWENFIEPYFNILYPSPIPGRSVGNSFGYRALVENAIPVWARPISFVPHPLQEQLKQKVLMLEVAPDQSMAEACYHVARFLRVNAGELQNAENFLQKALEFQPNFPQAKIEQAIILILSDRIAEGSRIARETFASSDAQLIANSLPEILTAFALKGATLDAADFIRAVASLPNADWRPALEAAWILTTNPNPAGRNPTEAQAFLERIPTTGIPEQDIFKRDLIAAALLASAGNWQQAQVAALKVAEVAAAKYPIVADRARAMAASYAQGKFWTP